MVEISDTLEGSMEARALTLQFYDIEMQKHRLWQAIRHLDRMIVDKDTCSYPDYLVYTVEQEIDYLLGERLGLTAQVELFQRDLECCRTEAKLARTEAVLPDLRCIHPGPK